MKHVRHLLVAALTVFLAAVLAVPAFAAGTGSITVTTPDNVQSTDKNTYSIYKVFDAVSDGNGHYSYKLVAGKTTVPAGFVKDDAGNVYLGTQVAKDAGDINVIINSTEVGIDLKDALDQTTIDAIAAYVANDDAVDTKEITGSGSAVFDGLDEGYYFINTTTGTLVVIDSTTPAQAIKDKNKVPSLDKKITNANSVSNDVPSTTDLDETGKWALAQVGTNVEYTLTVTKRTGAENYVVKDELGTGLKYNKDAKVYVGGTEVAPSTTDTKTFVKTTETDSNLVITFDNDYTAALADETVITIKYTALVTEDALHTDPAKNTAWLEYGHTPGQNKTPKVETETYNATINVLKTDGKDQPLAGAGFILQDKTSKKYYKIDNNGVVSWVDSKDAASEKITAVEKTYYTDEGKTTLSPNNAETDYFTSEAKISFTGLPNGTYTLIEKTVPTGYNAAADSEFIINNADTTTAANRLQSTTVVNNQGTELPETGGMGTTILYIVGGGMVIAGIVMFLTKRRMASIEK